MPSPLHILVVEDNFEHLRLTRYVLEKNGVEGELHVVRDGEEAMDYLQNRNAYEDRERHPRPSIVLLDFNIPRIDGKEVLRRIKEDPRLMGIPVVVVSSSTRPEDVAAAERYGASAYISKSAGFEKFTEELASIRQFIDPPSLE